VHFLVALDEPVGKRAGDDGEVPDADDHERHREDLSEGSRRQLVAVTDRRHGRDRPVDAVEIVRLGEVERGSARCRDEHGKDGRVLDTAHRERDAEQRREA